MSYKKISQLGETYSVGSNDLLLIAKDNSGTYTNNKIKMSSVLDYIQDGITPPEAFDAETSIHKGTTAGNLAGTTTIKQLANVVDGLDFIESGDNVSELTNDAGYVDASELSAYAKLDGTNQPFTGNITVSKSNPKLTVTDSGLASSAYLERMTTLDGTQVVSQNRLWALGNAVNLGGSTYGSGLSYTSTAALSFSFWWKTSNAGDSYFIGNSSASSDFRWGSGVLSFQDEAAGLARYWSATGFNNDTWRHIALTISSDRATVKAYINGTLATQTQAGTVGGNFIINRIFATNGNTTGSFDDFIIYTKELSQSEVTALYASGAPIEITDMTSVYGYYKLNATSGTTAVDSSGSSRTVTLVGGSPTWSTGIVAAGINPLVDIPFNKMVNNNTNASYGTLTHGYYLGSFGTSDVYEGLSHQFNYLGSSKMTIGSSGVNISAYTGSLAASGALSAGTTVTATTSMQAGTSIQAGTGLYSGAGTAGTPSHSFASDTDTGMYSGGSNVIRFATAGTERLSVIADGKVAIGAITPTALLDINSDTIRLRTAKTPASATATGNAGDIAWDANYIYVCVATNTWKRTALTTW